MSEQAWQEIAAEQTAIAAALRVELRGGVRGGPYTPDSRPPATRPAAMPPAVLPPADDPTIRGAGVSSLAHSPNKSRAAWNRCQECGEISSDRLCQECLLLEQEEMHEAVGELEQQWR